MEKMKKYEDLEVSGMYLDNVKREICLHFKNKEAYEQFVNYLTKEE